MEILEREIKGFITVDGEKAETTKTIGEIIDSEKDLVVTDDGVTVLKIKGIQKLADFVGAKWGKPEVIMSTSNEVRVIVECIFPDGSNNYGPGESTPKNTKIGADYPFAMAVNRARSISFLRSQYMALYDIYSEEEADAFKTAAAASQLQANNEEVVKLKEADRRNKTMIAEMLKLIALPDEDEEYPKAYVTEVWDVHQDIDYLKKLTQHPDKVIQFVAKQKLKLVEAEQEKSSAKTA